MKIDEMERAKKIYEETEIPKELHGMVAELIENDRKKGQENTASLQSIRKRIRMSKIY